MTARLGINDTMSEVCWEAVVKAPQGGPVYTHHFEAGPNETPSDLLRSIADALDLSAADGVQISIGRVAHV